MTLYVSEYSALAIGGTAQLPQEPPIVEYTIASGAKGPQAFNAATRFIRVHADSASAMQIAFGPFASAATTASSQRLSAGSTEYKAVPQGGGYTKAAANIAT